MVSSNAGCYHAELDPRKVFEEFEPSQPFNYTVKERNP